MTHPEETAHPSDQGLVERLGRYGSPDTLIGREERDGKGIGAMFRRTLLRLAGQHLHIDRVSGKEVTQLVGQSEPLPSQHVLPVDDDHGRRG